MKKITIAIDGYSSSGKSSMARHLASTIGYRYVDSGAMYRAVTLAALRAGCYSSDSLDTERLLDLLPQLQIDFKMMPDGSQHTLLQGEDVETVIRSMDVAEHVSEVAALPQVRHRLVAMQQAYGKDGGIVMDGRDIGTTVFPDAQLKIFVNASPQTRAQRRLAELQVKGVRTSYEEVLANVRSRDYQDENRAESPLRRADDAIDLDNSNMSIEEQNSRLLELFQNAISHED